MKKRILALFCVCAMMVCLISGCKSNNSSDEPKTFTMAVPYFLETLNPGNGGDDVHTTTVSPIYDRLYYPVAGDIEYRLAKSVVMSEDGLVYTIKLNEDAVWSDGKPITVDDVIFTKDYVSLSSSSYVEVNGEPVEYVKIDDKTLEVKCPSPYGEFINTLGGLRLMPAHAFEGDVSKVDGSTYFSDPAMATSGAYKVSEINEDSVVMVKRDDYYRGTANIDTVVVKLIGEGSTSQIAFENNEISYMRVTSAAELEKYNADTEKYNVHSLSQAYTNYLILNPNSPNLQSAEAREAICLALNKAEIIEGTYGSEDFATPANSLFNPEQTVWSEDLKGYEQDIKRAKQLAESSGLTEKTLKYYFLSDRSAMEDTAIIIQQQLANIGITVEIEGCDAQKFMEFVAAPLYGNGNEDKWDFATNGLDSMRGDYAHHVNMIATTQPLYGMSDDAIAKCAALEATTNQEEMIKAGAELHDQLMSEYRDYPLNYTNYVMVSHKNITGLDQTLIPEFTDWLAIDVE